MNTADARVAENVRFVHYLVGRRLGLKPRHADYWDMVQDATIALIRAARGFDPDRGLAFTTYAGRAICNALDRAHMVASRNGFSHVGEGRERKAGLAPRPVSLDAGEDGTLYRMLPDESAQPERDDGLWAAVDGLASEYLRTVVRLRYVEGLNDAAIGRRLGRSRAAIFEARKRALTALRGRLEPKAAVRAIIDREDRRAKGET